MTFLSKVFSTLVLAIVGASTVQANDKIDRSTETAIPRSKNLYGIGVGVLPKTSGSDEYRAIALPIINGNYGNFYINALQAGVWLIDSEDKRLRFGLSTQARFGWDAEDGNLTRGMDDRDFTLDLGPTVRLQTDYGTFNVKWGFDIGGASNGQTVDLQYVKSLYSSRALRVNGSLGASWNSRQFNDYYFGVGAHETTALRPAYDAGSSTEFSVGINSAYAVGKSSYLLLGGALTRLGGEQANSPIVETRMQPFMYVGYSMAY